VSDKASRSAAAAKPSDAWEALFRAQVSIIRDLRRDFTNVGMSMNEYDVLFNTYRAPDHRIRLRELNASVLITQSSVSRLVDRLVARDYMVKREDELDARGTVVELTNEGVRAFRSAAIVHTENINDRVGSVLTQSELNALRDICTKLRETAEE